MRWPLLQATPNISSFRTPQQPARCSCIIISPTDASMLTIRSLIPTPGDVGTIPTCISPWRLSHGHPLGFLLKCIFGTSRQEPVWRFQVALWQRKGLLFNAKVLGIFIQWPTLSLGNCQPLSVRNK